MVQSIPFVSTSRDFSHLNAIQGTVDLSDPSTCVGPICETAGHAGFVYKMLVAHPNLASRRVGVLAAKRLKCGSQSCVSFKLVMCFKHPSRDMFASVRSGHETDNEKITFANAVKNGAWDSPGTANAKMKSEWKCDSDSQAKADVFAAAF